MDITIHEATNKSVHIPAPHLTDLEPVCPWKHLKAQVASPTPWYLETHPPPPPNMLQYYSDDIHIHMALRQHEKHKCHSSVHHQNGWPKRIHHRRIMLVLFYPATAPPRFALDHHRTHKWQNPFELKRNSDNYPLTPPYTISLYGLYLNRKNSFTVGIMKSLEGGRGKCEEYGLPWIYYFFLCFLINQYLYLYYLVLAVLVWAHWGEVGAWTVFVRTLVKPSCVQGPIFLSVLWCLLDFCVAV